MYTVSSGLPTAISVAKLKNPEQKAQLSAISAEYQMLIGELFHAEQALHTAQNNFDYLYEPKNIDVCIYQMQTAQSQYDNIFCKLKTLLQQAEELKASI